MAIIPVVLYHAGIVFSGGYVGVDVFFVISGFLITSLILKDLQNGKFTFPGFWERRARRIIPAMAVLVLATLLAGWLWMLPEDYATFGKSGIYQALFGANIYFRHDSGYFAGLAEEKPLLHTWSLAVEEQFYLFVPLMLFGLFKIPALRTRKALLIVFISGLLISLGLSIHHLPRHPSSTFYLLPTRAWELLCGSFVAIVPLAVLPGQLIVREIISWIGLAAILVPCCFYTKTTPFPGLAAVPPCFGTALLIWSTRQPDNTSTARPTVYHLLTLRPIVFIGLISYSLYLWHWPIFALNNYWHPVSNFSPALLIALALILSALSWLLVELPFRKRALCASRNAMLAMGGACVALVLALSIVVYSGQGYPSRIKPAALNYAKAASDKAFILELTATDIQAGKLIRIGNPDPTAPTNLLVWGDSHAMAAMPAIDQMLRETGTAGLQATASATAPALDAYWKSEFTNPGDVKNFNAAVFQFIQSKKIPNVLLVARWDYYTDNIASAPLSQSLLSTVNRLVAAGITPWILLQVPRQPAPVPKTLALAAMAGRDTISLTATLSSWDGLSGDDPLLIEKLQKAGARILNPRACFLNPERTHFIAEKDGICLYRDANHLSASGARLMLAPFLRTNLILGTVSKPISGMSAVSLASRF